MNTGFNILKESVIDVNLCTRCGTCIGVCPRDAVIVGDPLGMALPELIGDCTDCDAPCIIGCPAVSVDFPALNEFTFPGEKSDYLFGVTKGHYIVHSNDQVTRQAAASGGAITELNKYMLEKGLVDGVMTLIVTDDQPLLPRPEIITDVEQLKLAQQSKYSIAPTNTILNQLEDFDGMVSYVGLPCQIHSIRKLQMAGNKLAKKIKVIIGSYCGGLLYFSAITDLLGKFKITDISEIKKLEYRAGEWPGKTKITMNDGRTVELEKFYANYMNLFYPVERCLTCTDLTSEFADISAGDAWAPVYEGKGKGFSLIVTRTSIGNEIVNDCISDGYISSTEISRKDAITMHSHGLDNKKKGGFIRMSHLKMLGKPVPEYGYKPVKLGLSRNIIGALISMAFLVGRTNIARKTVLLFSLESVGKVFKKARTLWKKFTTPERKKGILSYDVETFPIEDKLKKQLDLASREEQGNQHGA